MPERDNPERAAGGLPGRARALGRELVRVHDWLRAELARVRDELAAAGGGEHRRGMPLQAHCLAFCEALARHHVSEDSAGFPALAGQFPGLAPVLEQLSQDHRLVGDILHRLRELLASATPDNVEPVRREVDGLAAILESHFQWEERRLASAFSQLETPPPARELFGLEP